VMVMGGVGLGLVLGWLAGRMAVLSPRPDSTVPLLVLVLLPVVGLTTYFSRLPGTAGYLIGAVTTFAASSLWFGSLERRPRRKA
jgi:hypothetical protein